jgi:hypothetical protein
MKHNFNSSQEYQLEAIKAVIEVFDCQVLNKGNLKTNTFLQFKDAGVDFRTV